MLLRPVRLRPGHVLPWAARGRRGPAEEMAIQAGIIRCTSVRRRLEMVEIE